MTVLPSFGHGDNSVLAHTRIIPAPAVPALLLPHHRLAETIETWWPAVEAAITTGYSNARSEDYNRLAKHVGQNAFGSAT